MFLMILLEFIDVLAMAATPAVSEGMGVCQHSCPHVQAATLWNSALSGLSKAST
jgi:hypothetical protein